ncbi:MAG TPA: BtpA/SgcQ family protein [Acidimicrobiales bacterium]|nr:BtpA/SgcQ family protein [Acidimicrobiales bacterium]
MDVLTETFGVKKPLIAMCHLLGLPGRPRHDAAGGMEKIYQSLAHEVHALQDAGVDGLLFCNEHDLPYSTSVGVEAGAAMAAVIGRLRADIRLPFGVDLLWDAKLAVAVARATGASFVREVFTGVYESDMGLFAPDFGDIAAYRHAIGADDVKIFANITPESAKSVSNRPVADRAKGAVYMGVDVLLISGPAAGAELELSDLVEAKEAVGDFPVLANTGVRESNVTSMLAVADGAIVGTSLKEEGSTWTRVEPARATRMVELFKAEREAAAS